MKKKTVYTIGTLIMVFVLHLLFAYWSGLQISRKWVQIDNTSFLSSYLEQKDYFMGLSYALASAFTVYAILRFLENRNRGISGAIGGFTITGILYFGGCFLLGCCGSPMLAVYLNLFGTSFLGFTKQLTFILTFLSVVIGYFWMKRKANSATCCCEGNDKCKGT